jgi:tryptophan synthase beta chain
MQWGLRAGRLEKAPQTPVSESAHAIRAAIDEAIAAREAGQKRVILFNLSGHGLLDLASYEAYFTGRLKDG